MGYDLHFTPPGADPAAGAPPEAGGPLSDERREQWDAVVRRARAALPGAEVRTGTDRAELADARRGISLVLTEHAARLSVAGGDTGEDALAVMTVVYDLAHAVEEETGLQGYDPQLGERVSDLGLTPPASGPAPAAAGDAAAGTGRGAGGSAPADGAGSPGPADDDVDPYLHIPTERGRPWWQFWRR